MKIITGTKSNSATGARKPLLCERCGNPVGAAGGQELSLSGGGQVVAFDCTCRNCVTECINFVGNLPVEQEKGEEVKIPEAESVSKPPEQPVPAKTPKSESKEV